jgi:hypothetical protein
VAYNPGTIPLNGHKRVSRYYPTDELITSRFPVFWSEWESRGNSLTQALTRARLTHN